MNLILSGLIFSLTIPPVFAGSGVSKVALPHTHLSDIVNTGRRGGASVRGPRLSPPDGTLTTQEDPIRIEQARRQAEELARQRQQEEERRRAVEEQAQRQVLERERAAALERDRQRQEEQKRIEQERERAIEENKKANEELERQKEAADKRRQELEQKRQEGTLELSAITLKELQDLFRNSSDLAVKESWACMIIITDRSNEEAIQFLREERGWNQEEIDGLNPI